MLAWDCCTGLAYNAAAAAAAAPAPLTGPSVPGALGRARLVAGIWHYVRTRHRVVAHPCKKLRNLILLIPPHTAPAWAGGASGGGGPRCRGAAAVSCASWQAGGVVLGVHSAAVGATLAGCMGRTEERPAWRRSCTGS